MLNLFQPPAGLLGDQEEAIRQQMQTQGLLGLAAGLFQAGTPSRTPQSLGGSALQGLMAGQQMASNTFDQALKAQVLQEQMAEMRRKRAEEETIRKFLPQIYQAPTPATQEVIASEQGDDVLTRPGTPGGVNYDALRQLMLAAPERGAKIAEGLKSLQPEYLTVGESVYQKGPQGLTPVISSTGKFTGDFGNVALGLYGTLNATEILARDPNAFNKIQVNVIEQNRAKSTNINIPGGDERKAGFLANRVKFGLEQMSAVIGKNPPSASPETVPSIVKYLTNSDFLSNKLTSADRQSIEAAQLDVLDAALTLGTGAAYTREQLEGYRKSYFPQLGDSEQTIKGKQARLQNLLESSYISAGRAAPKGEMPIFNPPQAAQKSAPKAGKAPSGVPQDVWNNMTDEERKLWQK